jgi:hypothetical protein
MSGIGRGVARQRLGLENGLGFGIETDLKFKKTGSEIQVSIQRKLEELVQNCKNDEKEIAEICERRGVEAKEVIDAANDENATAAYESKAYGRLPTKHNKAVEDMQADMNLLRQLSASISFTRTGIESLGRVSKNIELKREFDLDFQELTLFGF